MKFLWAPILDVYYFEWAGKRKTYLIPAIIIIGCINLYLGSRIDNFIDNVDVKLILLFGLTIVFTLSLMVISIDGWLIHILDECYYGVGAATRHIGRITGNFIGFILFI